MRSPVVELHGYLVEILFFTLDQPLLYLTVWLCSVLQCVLTAFVAAFVSDELRFQSQHQADNTKQKLIESLRKNSPQPPSLLVELSLVIFFISTFPSFDLIFSPAIVILFSTGRSLILWLRASPRLLN